MRSILAKCRALLSSLAAGRKSASRNARARRRWFEPLEPRLALASDLGPAAAPLIDFDVALYRPDGTEVASLAPGEEFVVKAFASDLREQPAGVLAAYMDVSWDKSLAMSTGPISFSDDYRNLASGVVHPGEIASTGARAGDTPLGAGRFEVFSVPMRAIGVGSLVFSADPSSHHDVLLFGVAETVGHDQIDFGQFTVDVAGQMPASQEELFGPSKVALDVRLLRPDGTAASSLAAGDEFILTVHVTDLRDTPQGVFSAYLDVTWDSRIAVSTGPIQHAAPYVNGKVGTVAGGLIDEAGGFAGLSPQGGGTFELFRVPMRAISSGTLEFIADPADTSHLDTTLYGDFNGEIHDGLIRFGSTVIEVMAGSGVAGDFLAAHDAFTILKGRRDVTLTPLANDASLNNQQNELSIVAVGVPSHGGSVEIAADGKSLLYFAWAQLQRHRNVQLHGEKPAG